jgi:WD40 repeat protein
LAKHRLFLGTSSFIRGGAAVSFLVGRQEQLALPKGRKWMFATRRARLALAIGVTAVTGAAAAFPLVPQWSPPMNLESIPGSSANLNTPAVDGCASLSPDGMTIAFTSNRTGNFDIYLATRRNRSVGFGNPVPLPAPINTAANDACPTLTSDALYYSSDRDDPAYDLYVSQRLGAGWSGPRRLGRNINAPGVLEESAAPYFIGGHEILLFSIRNPDGSGGKIYQSIDGGRKTLVQGGINSASSDNRPSITADAKTIYFDSDRTGTLGGSDLYFATRRTPFGAFGPATHMTAQSSPGFDARPFVSMDGTMLTYSSSRAGSTSPAPDIWFSTH